MPSPGISEDHGYLNAVPHNMRGQKEQKVHDQAHRQRHRATRVQQAFGYDPRPTLGGNEESPQGNRRRNQPHSQRMFPSHGDSGPRLTYPETVHGMPPTLAAQPVGQVLLRHMPAAKTPSPPWTMTLPEPCGWCTHPHPPSGSCGWTQAWTAQHPRNQERPNPPSDTLPMTPAGATRPLTPRTSTPAQSWPEPPSHIIQTTTTPHNHPRS